MQRPSRSRTRSSQSEPRRTHDRHEGARRQRRVVGSLGGGPHRPGTGPLAGRTRHAGDRSHQRRRRQGRAAVRPVGAGDLAELEPGQARHHAPGRPGVAGADPLAQHRCAGVPDGRQGRCGAERRSHAPGRRADLVPGGHHLVHRRARAGRCAALPRSHCAAVHQGLDRLRAEVRIFLAHPGPCRRHGLPEVAGRPRLPRVLRREPAALGPVDLGRRTRLAARPQRAHRREREVLRQDLRRRPLLHRDQRLVDVEPRDHDVVGDARRLRAVRPQRPQVHRAGADDDRRGAHLPGAVAQPSRHHRADLCAAADRGGDQGRDPGQPAGAGQDAARRFTRSSPTPPTMG